ncbi:MAG: hypothetical protein JWN13_1573 [Betaproteobacteria bacterium]|jgi:hypothetical protein|nr:hypothetical protein [Betaproteobacteria bacterium]
MSTISQAVNTRPITVLLAAWAVFILPMPWMGRHTLQWMTGGVIAIAVVLIWADFLQLGSTLGLRAYGEAKRQKTRELMWAAWSFAKDISLPAWGRISIVLGGFLLIATFVGVTRFISTLPWQGWALIIMLLFTALLLRTKLS